MLHRSVLFFLGTDNAGIHMTFFNISNLLLFPYIKYQADLFLDYSLFDPL